MNCVSGVTARELYICTLWEMPEFQSISYWLYLGFGSMTVLTQFAVQWSIAHDSLLFGSTVTVLKPIQHPFYQQLGTNPTVEWTRSSALLTRTFIIGHGSKFTPSTAQQQKRTYRD